MNEELDWESSGCGLRQKRMTIYLSIINETSFGGSQ